MLRHLLLIAVVYGIPAALAFWFGGIDILLVTVFAVWLLCSLIGIATDWAVERGYLPTPKKSKQ